MTYSRPAKLAAVTGSSLSPNVPTVATSQEPPVKVLAWVTTPPGSTPNACTAP